MVINNTSSNSIISLVMEDTNHLSMGMVLLSKVMVILSNSVNECCFVNYLLLLLDGQIYISISKFVSDVNI